MYWLIQVCDCARARERERELLYPDACGGGGRGWISQGGPSFARAHSLKETCALHTARLSCDALVDFWSALGEETRRSLLRMKEEDFVDRLMFRYHYIQQRIIGFLAIDEVQTHGFLVCANTDLRTSASAEIADAMF